jgi:hypothetical protein
MSTIKIASRREADLIPFLELNDYSVEEIGDNILRVQKEEELPVYISVNNDNLYFEVDLGNVNAFASQDMYFQLLDMNTEVLPVSFGINNTNPDDPRLVLVESRETGDLNDQELLAVFDALELAVDKAEGLLAGFMK